MSSIEKMTIQGIRSYGPRETDTQVIEFFFPVTLIIGQNGSGKTTVIECLKYACTGDMPPNTRGGAFVFDPKLIDEVETRGRIKLYFRDTSNLYVQVQKNLACVQKAKKQEFRTLETMISRYSKENKLVSTITSKCINADAEIINAFGVSKAVLDHVIFVHQEDSNWPLSEGRVLKTRFDEIFAATKYIKAMDVLRKIRLEKAHLVKEKDIEKKFLEQNKQRCEQLKSDLATNQAKYESLKEKKEAILEKLKPIQKEIEFYFQESARIFQVKQELDKIENERALLEKQIKELLMATKHCLFSGTDDELKEHIREFEQKSDQMRRDQEEATLRKINDLNLKLKELNARKSRLTIEIGAVENKNKLNNENKEKLNNLLKRAGSLMNCLSHEDVTIEKINEFVHEYQTETNSLEELKKREDSEMQHKIDAERDLKSKMDQSITNKKDLIGKNQKQLDQIKSELKFISNDSLMTSLNAEIDSCESELQTKSESITDNNKIKDELKELESSRGDLRSRELKLDARISEMHANAKHQTEVDLLKQDKQSKDEQIRKIRLRIKDDLEAFFEDDFESDLRNDLNLKTVFENKSKTVLNDLTSYQNKKKEIEKRLYSNEMKRKMHYDDLRAKEAQLRQYEDKLMQLDDCILTPDDIENYDSIFQKVQESHRALLDENGYMVGVDKTYKRFLSQLQETKSVTDNNKLAKSVETDCVSCPVCLRIFKDQSELDDTIRELSKYSSKLPQKMKDLQARIDESEAKIQKMIQMKPTKESYESLKTNDIVNLKAQIDELDRNVVPKIKAELKANQESLDKLDSLKSCCDLLQNEIVLIDKYANEAKDLEKKIQIQMINLSRLNSNESTTSLDDLNLMKSELQAELQALNKKIQSKQDELNSSYALTDKINSLKERLNTLKTRRNDLESKMQKRTQLSEKQKELLDENEQTQTEIESLNEELKKLIENICEMTSKRQQQLNSNRDLFRERTKLLNELNSIRNSCEELDHSIRGFEQNDSSKLVDLKRDIKQIEREESEINVELNELRASLDELKSEMARYEIKQRELMDNLKLREKRVEYELKKDAYLKKREEIKLNDSKLDLSSFKAEQAKCEAKRDELTQEYNQIKTHMNIIEGKLHALKDELDHDAYKNALEKYSVCASDLRVLEEATRDIEKYFKALDRAVMNYHLLKMNEINKIIKQLWRQVYKGNDIDFIEIRSEEENAEEEMKETKRRAYNYRVVLVKGETSFDMRGRCSAGQKVLASIIIRLALAETFCLNSGILALDEPTTNLDRENIESLASALVEIIKTRSRQKNFQLIIITHDEDFVEMLGRSEYMDQYYRVKKDENGFSRIYKRSNYDNLN